MTESLLIKESEEIDTLKEIDKVPSDTKFIISLILPALIIFIIIILFPVITGILVSIRDSSAVTGYFGKNFTLGNYIELLTWGRINSRAFWQYTYQTIFFSIVSLFLEFSLGLIFALILNKKFPGRGISRATLLIPWALPTIASATIFRYEIFAPAEEFGLINNILEILSLRPIAWFGPDAAILFELPVLVPYDPYFGSVEITTTMFTAIIIDVWKTTPFITLLILAALQIVSEDLYKAADVAGASGLQKFRYITWPLIKPGIGVAIVFRMMDAFRVYDAIVVFRDPSVRSMTWFAVDFWLRGQEYGLASSVTVILFLMIIISAIVILRATGREERKSKEEDNKLEISRVEKTSLEKGYSSNRLKTKKQEEQKPKQENSKSLEIDYPLKGLEPISESRIKWFRAKLYINKFLFAIGVIFMCLFCAAPFFWIILRSFRDPFVPQTEFELFPAILNLRAYGVVFETSEFTGVSFDRALLNGFILSGLTVIVVLIIGSLIAYALAKFEFKFKSPLGTFIFFMTSLPPLIIIIPFFIQISAMASVFPFLDFRDNIFGLILPYSAFNLPLAVFVLQAFFREIPEDLWQAAKVDGASNFQIFRKVILPLTIPGIFTCAILIFIASWNELLFAQIWLASDINHTVPRAILRFVQSPLSLTADWDTDIALMAATSIATVPLVIIVLIFQKKIISGLTRGAVKG